MPLPRVTLTERTVGVLVWRVLRFTLWLKVRFAADSIAPAVVKAPKLTSPPLITRELYKLDPTFTVPKVLVPAPAKARFTGPVTAPVTFSAPGVLRATPSPPLWDRFSGPEIVPLAALTVRGDPASTEFSVVVPAKLRIPLRATSPAKVTAEPAEVLREAAVTDWSKLT